MFTSAHLHLCSPSHPHIYISHLHLSLFLTFSQGRGQCPRTATKRNPLRRSCVSSARNAGESAIWFCRGHPLRRSCVSDARNAGESAICPGRGQPSAKIVRVECAKVRIGCAKCRRECDLVLSRAICSAEIVRVGCAKCRRECDLSRSRATLCGDGACRMRETQARVRFVPVAGNHLRRSCVSDARNAGESAICPGRGQPSAKIVRVECAKVRIECAKCRRECDLVLSGATLCSTA